MSNYPLASPVSGKALKHRLWAALFVLLFNILAIELLSNRPPDRDPAGKIDIVLKS